MPYIIQKLYKKISSPSENKKNASREPYKLWKIFKSLIKPNTSLIPNEIIFVQYFFNLNNLN